MAADAGYDAVLINRAKVFSFPESPDSERRFQRQLNANSFTAVARKAEAGEGVDPGVVLESYAGPDVRAALPFEIPVVSGLSRMVGWAYLMGKTRRAHIRKFLDAYSDARAAPAMAVHHLVDYDYWLDDEPDPRSTLLKQVRVFSRLAERFADRIELRTFAGFCPLRHAIETVAGVPTLFDAYKSLAANGTISGFKLYPPMGFKPSGNAALSDGDFNPPGRAPRTALDRWRQAGGRTPLGQALDASLEEFFQWCAANGVPMMAHAGPGNEAGPGFGQRANPLGWEPVAARYPIRLSLGHLVNAAEPFIRAVCDPAPDPADVWALHGSLRMLDPGNPAVRAEVYGDLGYMPELIGNPSLARKFFAALRDAFGARDPGLTRILYGSDWIMLGIERNFDANLTDVIDGMRAADYTTEQQENILYRNARRFLRL